MSHVLQYLNGSHVCGTTTNGQRFVRTGCSHRDPASAIRHATNLDNGTPYVSPLRESAEPAHPSLSAPQPAASITGSADVPRHVSAPARTR
jgi:hypothetical protein